MRTNVHSQAAPQAIGPYSQAVWMGEYSLSFRANPDRPGHRQTGGRWNSGTDHPSVRQFGAGAQRLRI